jgi:hypothetical protein
MEWLLSSLHKKAYGDWVGNPQGMSPDPARCCEAVWRAERFARESQCGRARGYGPEKAYCKQHDPEAVAAREKAASDRYNAQWENRRLEIGGKYFFAALCKIADGDNDPRATAAVAIAGFKRPPSTQGGE